MSRTRVLAYAMAFSLSLFLSAVEFQPGALAQTERPYQVQIAEFNSKLESARSTRADLDRRVACLNQREAQLTSERRDKELALGKLRSQELELARDLQTKQAAYDGFRATFLSEQDKLGGLRRELGSLQARQRAQEAWIQKCEEEKDWKRLWGLTCRADMNLAKTFGQIKNYENDISAAEKKEQIARQSMEFARANLDGGERALTAARKQAGDLGAEITRTETSIVDVSKALADIRASIQPLQIVIDEFSNALNEAKDVDLADARPRTLRRLGDIAAGVDTAMAGGRGAVADADGTLGAGWIKSCRAS